MGFETPMIVHGPAKNGGDLVAMYRVEEYGYGVIVFGSIPVEVMVAMCKRYPKGVLDPSIAKAKGGWTCIVRDAESAKKWRAELDLRIDHPDWLHTGDTGTSSLTIYSVLKPDPRAIISMGVPHVGHPHDGDDFGRCYRLVKRFGWESRLGEVTAKYPFWGPFVERWADLCAWFEEEGKLDQHGMPTVKTMPLMYERMSPIVQAAQIIKRPEK